MTLIAIVNMAMETAAWYNVIPAVILCRVAQFALDGGIALIIHFLPERWFCVDRPLYRVSETEKRLYKTFKVRKWKDKAWELGGLGGFSKKHLIAPGSPAYLEQFIVECNKGVLTHRLSYPIGFITMFFLPGICAFSIALPVAAVNLVLNVLPTMVLRYNTPKLQAMLKRAQRQSNRTSVPVG